MQGIKAVKIRFTRDANGYITNLSWEDGDGAAEQWREAYNVEVLETPPTLSETAGRIAIAATCYALVREIDRQRAEAIELQSRLDALYREIARLKDHLAVRD